MGEVGGVTLVDDYGHHPAEVEATLSAAQSGYGRRVVVAFQPHRYTRTRDLFDDFTRAFNKADVLVVTDVYAAGEAPIAGATSEALAQAVREHGHHSVTYVPDKRKVPDVLEQIAEPHRDALVALTKRDLDPEPLAELDEDVRDDVLEQLDSKEIAAAARELETDDAASLLEDLPEQERQEVLAELPAQDRADIETALAFEEDTAGRLMQRSLVKVPDYWTVGQVIDYCREASDLPDDVYDLFVVDRMGRLRGSVKLGRMLRTKRPVPIVDLVDPEIPAVPADTPQEEVAHLFRDQDLVSCPVIDADRRLLGVIMVDDVVDVIDEEAEEDILKMGGVGVDDVHANTLETTQRRAWWLGLNLLTAIVASLVIGQFEGAIEKIVVLAVLMPIVASMGGNAGTQTVTVAVRALAMGELTAANALRFIGKEFAVGGLNGLIFAALMGAGVCAADKKAPPAVADATPLAEERGDPELLQLAESLHDAVKVAPLEPVSGRRRIPRLERARLPDPRRTRETIGEDLVEDGVAHPRRCHWPRGPLRAHPLTEPTASPPVMNRWLSRYTIAGGSVSMIENAETSGQGIADA